MDFDKYLVDSPKYYRITQRTFRHLDEQVLAMALAALPQSVRDYMYRNVSRNTAEMLKDLEPASQSASKQVLFAEELPVRLNTKQEIV